MTKQDWASLTWEEVDHLPSQGRIALLPLGATEAHGPHLPLSTDVLIAQAMCREAAIRLEASGHSPLVLPPLAYTAAPFADAFPGTISIRPETVTHLIVDIGTSLDSQGFNLLALSNAHLDPAHIGSIRDAIKILRESASIRIAFPDLTRKPWALRLTDEFKSGACHAGCYEGSIVLAEHPDLVRDEIRRSLPENPASLSLAIGEGKTSFAEAGGPRAYFGSPAAATAEEGRKTIEVLATILEESVLEELARENT